MSKQSSEDDVRAWVIKQLQARGISRPKDTSTVPAGVAHDVMMEAIIEFGYSFRCTGGDFSVVDLVKKIQARAC